MYATHIHIHVHRYTHITYAHVCAHSAYVRACHEPLTYEPRGAGWVLHAAPPNMSEDRRSALAVTYVNAGARVLPKHGLRRSPDDEVPYPPPVPAPPSRPVIQVWKDRLSHNPLSARIPRLGPGGRTRRAIRNGWRRSSPEQPRGTPCCLSSTPRLHPKSTLIQLIPAPSSSTRACCSQGGNAGQWVQTRHARRAGGAPTRIPLFDDHAERASQQSLVSPGAAHFARQRRPALTVPQHHTSPQ